VKALKFGRRRRAVRSFGRWVDATGPEACLTVAEHFAAVPDQERALTFLHRLLAEHPANAKALTMLVGCLAAAERPLEALAAAREAAERCPGEAGLWHVLAERELAMDLRTEALRAAEKGLTLSPDDPELSRLKFETLLGLRRVAEAGQVTLGLPTHEIAAMYADHDYAERALEIFGQESGTDALRPHVQLLVAEDRFPEAIALARQAVDADPSDPYPRAVLSEALSNQGREDEALAEAERALADGLDGDIAEEARRWIRSVVGDSPQWSYFTASEPAAQRHSDRRGAPRPLSARLQFWHRTWFRRLAPSAATGARRPDRLLEVAERYADKGRERATLRVLTKLPRLVPEPPDVTTREARMLARFRRYSEAERLLARLAARSPGDPAVLLMIASTLSGFDRDGLAAEYAASAVAQAPFWATAYRDLLSYARWANRPDQGLRTARSAVSALPGDAEMWGLLADVTPPAESAQVVEEALTRFPAHRHVELLIKIARACRGSADSTAHQCLERALALNPSDMAATTEMAELLRSLGAHKEAIRLLQAFPSAADDNGLGDQYKAMGLPTLAWEPSGTARARRFPGLTALRRLRRAYEAEVLRMWESWAADSPELDRLEGLSTYERTVVRGSYETYTLTKVRRFEFRDRAATFMRRAATLVGGVGAWLVVFGAAPHLPEASGWGSVADASVAAAVGLLLHDLVRRRTNRLALRLPSPIPGGLELSALLGPGLALLYLARGPVPHMIGLCLLAMEVVLLARTARDRIFQFVTNLRDTLAHRRRPQDEIVYFLVMALDNLKNADGGLPPDDRWFAALMVESAARQVERDLMRNLPARDPATGAWATAVAKEAAHALRVVNRRLLTGQGAVDHVVAELRRAVRAVATGEYGRLRRMPCPPAPDRRRSWKERALSIARAIVIMGLPVLGIAVLYPIIGITGGAYRTALLVGAGWAALYLLLALDPTLREKIEFARSLLGTPSKNDTSSSAGRPDPKNQPPDR
jgi:tetratricopeptide (TPR) repeat protein